MKVKEESEKVGLKFNIQKTKIMASSPITLWQIDGKPMKIVREFIILGSGITADDDCNHEIKRCLLLGRKALTNLDSILKSRDIALSTKFHLVKAVIFFSSQVWMWELDHKESWMLEYWCFWTVVLKTPESLGLQEIQPVNPRVNRSWNFYGRTDTEAETPIVWPLDAKNWRRPWCWEKLKAGGEGDNRELDGWMASLSQWTWAWVSSGGWWWTGKAGMLQSMGS